ncbi:MAG: hypothetical protein IJZ85_10765 [Lachnospiraceae bacterium]|nr:hypothetical protein [Lachnospiraceae bacterium]
MEKKNFVTLVVGVISVLLFGIGMCMCLLPEWNLFNEGVIVTAIGAVALISLGIVCWVMAGKPVAKVNWKIAGKVIYGVVAALVLGIGMAMIMAFEGMMIVGLIVGVVGIVMLLGLIPMIKGFKTAE